MEIEFTWDPGKAKRNLTKHRASFETAKQVFFDPCLIVFGIRLSAMPVRGLCF
jgi:uncharacterized DUF497 family protein